MKTQELIKQAEELLAGIGEKEWSIFRGPYACGIAEKDGEVVLDFLADSPDSYEKAQFVAFSRNHMQELIDKLKKYEDAFWLSIVQEDRRMIRNLKKRISVLEEALTYCLFNPATNKAWSSHDQLIEEVREVQEVARKALGEE